MNSDWKKLRRFAMQLFPAGYAERSTPKCRCVKQMKSCVYIETSIPSYLTGRPSRDLIAVGWQQITAQWWDECRQNYDLYTSELVIAEASSGNPEAAERRSYSLKDIHELLIDDEVEDLASKLIENRAVPSTAKADAIHIAVATVQKMGFYFHLELQAH